MHDLNFKCLNSKAITAKNSLNKQSFKLIKDNIKALIFILFINTY